MELENNNSWRIAGTINEAIIWCHQEENKLNCGRQQKLITDKSCQTNLVSLRYLGELNE